MSWFPRNLIIAEALRIAGGAVLTLGDVSDGQVLSRSGNTIVGATIPGSSQVVRYTGAGGVEGYDTIAAAIAAAVSGDTILANPGAYSDDFTIPAGVRVVGFPAAQEVVITGQVTFGGTATLRECTVIAPNGPGPAIDATGLGAGELAVTFNVVVQGNSGGLSTGDLVAGAGAGILAAIGGLYHNGGATTGACVHISGGSVIGDTWIANFGSCGDFFRVSGTAGADVFGVQVQSSATYSCTSKIRVDSTGPIILRAFSGSQTAPAATNGLRITANAINLSLNQCSLFGTTNDVLIDSGLTGAGGSLIFNGCVYRTERRSTPAGFLDNLDIFVKSHVDPGLFNDPAYRLSEASVGSFDAPAELTVGTGDSVVPDAVWLYDASAGTYTDVSTAVKSRLTGSATMLGDVGDQLLVGYSFPFVSMKLNLSRALVPGSGTLQGQIWTGAALEDVRCLSVQADTPHRQFAQTPFELLVPSQIHLDFEGDADPDSPTHGEPYSNWTTSDPMADGVARYYFVWTVETAALATTAIIDRIKVGGSRFEGNGDGFPEYHGLGQGEPKLIANGGRLPFTGGGTPGSATFALSASVTVTKTLASFGANALEGFAVEHVLPRGINTAREFLFEVFWAVNGAATGDVEFFTVVSVASPGDEINSGTLPELTASKVETVTAANDAGVMNKTTFYFPLPTALTGDTVSVTLYRDSRASNTQDTLGGAVKIWETKLRAPNWTQN